MATKTFTGTLSQAMDSLAAEGNKIIFVPQQTVGDVLTGASSIMTVDSDGSYSVRLSYNTYSIYHYSDVSKRKIKIGDNIVVASDTTAETLSDLITSATGELTSDEVLAIQGYLSDTASYADAAADSYTDTLALFDDFDDNVIASVGEIHTDTPALSIPFNESGKLDYGIGVEYVSGLPVYEVEFTRSTASTVINKSGELEALTSDDIGIGSNGAWLHGAYTNLVKYSDDFTGSGWSAADITKTSSAGSIFGKSSTLLAGDGTGSASTSAYFLASGIDSDEGKYTASFFAKKASYDNLYCGIYDATNGAWIINPNSNYVDLSSGEDQIVELNFTKPLSCTELRVYVIRMVEALTMDAYISSVQLTKTAARVPFLSTSGAASSASSVFCAVPSNGNAPAPGVSFTIAIDSTMINSAGVASPFISTSNLTSDGLRAFRLTSAGSLYLDTSSTSGAFGSYPYDDGELHRAVLVVDNDNLVAYGYVDGDLIGSLSLSESVSITDEKIMIGSQNVSWYRNQQVRNVKMYHYAADAAEVASWGGAK